MPNNINSCRHSKHS